MNLNHLTKLKNSLPWLARYPFARAGNFLRRDSDKPKHLVFTIANHFEPSWSASGLLDVDTRRRRLDAWHKLAEKTGEAVVDSDGTKFRHTNFYPAEQYDRPMLEQLAQMQSEGLGEVEIHLHHGVQTPDTAENLRKTLIEFRDCLAEEHKCLSRFETGGKPMYAFVHGNHALGNSCGGRFCGVDNELQILQETGCYADMTLPTAPDQSQVPMLNQIYECGAPLTEKMPHRTGKSVRAFGNQPQLPLIFTGPLVFNWTRRVKGFPVLRIDDGALADNQPSDLNRLNRWQSANVTVRNQPEWIFIKLYCHGFFDYDQSACIGEEARRFFSEAVENGERTGDYKVHFTSAREAFNIVSAAIDGKTGTPHDYRNYRLKTIMKQAETEKKLIKRRLYDTGNNGKTLDKLKKIKGKSWTEIRTRGEQEIAARRDQMGWSGNLPTDEEFAELVDESFFGREVVAAEDLFDKFFEDAEYNFFPAFRQKEQTLKSFRTMFGEKSERCFIEQAEKIINGKFDLLGLKNLDFGAPIDWHFEPLSDKRSPRKHWKQIDELSTDETGDKKIVWELNRHQYFFDLGAAFWLTGDERYAETFAAHLDSWMRENPPGIGINWFSSLEVAFRSISWIWAFHFFKDSESFTPELFHKALKFVYLHGRHIEKYLSTFYSPNTHLTGEALGLYYLGTQFPFFKAAANWRAAGEKILFAELDRQICADGVYFEQSTWYQRYTADFYTHFYILKTLSGDKTGKELEKKLADKIQCLNDFLMFLTRPDGTTPLIGDDDGGKLLPRANAPADDFRAVLGTSAVLFGRGDYKFVAEEFAAETLWLLGETGARSFEDLRAEKPNKNSAAFKGGGYFVMRDGWTETDDFLLVDCGMLGSISGGHGHADALAINLAVGGRSILVDSGTYTYNESAEMRDYFRSTEAHNTLTIDGASQSEMSGKFSWKTKANAKLEKWIAADRFDFFEGSHDGYQKLSAPATHSRGILSLKNDYWIVRDFVKTRGKHDYALNFHFSGETDPSIVAADGDVSYVDEQSDAENGLRLFTFGDNGGWRKKESPISNCYGAKKNAPHLQFISSGVGAQEFFTFLLPNETGTDAPRAVEVPLNGGRAFVVNFRGYQDIFVFTDGEQIVRTEIFNTNFRFLWARLSQGEILPEEFVLIGGTHFTLGGREIINYPNELEFATARRFGSKLNVQTSNGVFSVSLPKNRPTAYILKTKEN